MVETNIHTMKTSSEESPLHSKKKHYISGGTNHDLDRPTEQFRSSILEAGGNRSLSILSNALKQLHQKFLRNPANSNAPDQANVRDIIASYTSQEVANLVYQCLRQHSQATGSHITNLRASVIYPFTGERPCPILHWREGADMDVMAIYLVDNYVETESQRQAGSWLMHFRRGISNHADDEHCRNSFIAWSVTKMSHLKTLFQAAQHILGILEWSKDDASRLYCEQGPEECSADDLARYAKLLFNHLLQIDHLNAAFDSILPLLENFSYKEGIKISRYVFDGSAFCSRCGANFILSWVVRRLGFH